MADGTALLEEMHKFEVKVVTALGFTSDDPVTVNDVSDEGVSWKWHGAEVPTSLPKGSYLAELSSDSAPLYRTDGMYMDMTAWLAIVEARRQWLSNFGDPGGFGLAHG